MKVEVPSERLTAQWNLGAQHIAMAAQLNPKTGRKWFNDRPYGILAAETFMILLAHDQMGAHKDAEDGFFQWVSLPIDQNVSIKKGPRDPNGVHHQQSLPDRPIGLFTDGSGSLTLAEGPPARGGNMDGVHAFWEPGSDRENRNSPFRRYAADGLMASCQGPGELDMRARSAA